ncbi:MAG: LysR family transcriptional regulator [Myxococcota bacterium]
MENWTHIRTAFLLGKLGTISATAAAAGVHRATVVRRIESLEEYLGGKLFQRHVKGYTPTELGAELVRTAERSDENFKTLLTKAKTTDDLSGDLVVSGPELVDPIVFGAVEHLKENCDQLTFRFRATNRLVKLEHGDAHVALAVGDQPKQLDYVVQQLMQMRIGLYRHRSLELSCAENLDKVNIQCRYPFVRVEGGQYGEAVNAWIEKFVPEERILLTATTARGANDAVIAGLGVGFLPTFLGSRHKALERILPDHDDWVVPVWLVTHVDLHRTLKVQRFVSALKALGADFGLGQY